jgi:hypothetical protein
MEGSISERELRALRKRAEDDESGSEGDEGGEGGLEESGDSEDEGARVKGMVKIGVVEDRDEEDETEEGEKEDEDEDEDEEREGLQQWAMRKAKLVKQGGSGGVKSRVSQKSLYESAPAAKMKNDLKDLLFRKPGRRGTLVAENEKEDGVEFEENEEDDDERALGVSQGGLKQSASSLSLTGMDESLDASLLDKLNEAPADIQYSEPPPSADSHTDHDTNPNNTSELKAKLEEACAIVNINPSSHPLEALESVKFILTNLQYLSPSLPSASLTEMDLDSPVALFQKHCYDVAASCLKGLSQSSQSTAVTSNVHKSFYLF